MGLLEPVTVDKGSAVIHWWPIQGILDSSVIQLFYHLFFTVLNIENMATPSSLLAVKCQTQTCSSLTKLNFKHNKNELFLTTML